MSRIENPLRIWHGRDWRQWVDDNIGEYDKDWWIEEEEQVVHSLWGEREMLRRKRVAFFVIPDACKATLFKLRWS